VRYEAPQRRSRDRIVAGPAGCDRRLDQSRQPSPDPDSDPTAALLLRVDPAPRSAEPTAVLALATAALGSPR
jgi:hypothetical protein